MINVVNIKRNENIDKNEVLGNINPEELDDFINFLNKNSESFVLKNNDRHEWIPFLPDGTVCDKHVVISYHPTIICTEKSYLKYMEKHDG